MATPTARSEDTDSLASLEERIHRAVQLVSQLRQEKDTIQKLFEEAVSEKETGDKTLIDLREQNKLLAEEINELKAERRQVRARIEKLLGQMDMLSAT